MTDLSQERKAYAVKVSVTVVGKLSIQVARWSGRQVDRLDPFRLAACEACGASLVDATVEAWDARRVQDLAPIYRWGVSTLILSIANEAKKQWMQ